MKQQIFIMIVSIFLVLGISFFIFNIQNSNFTGFAVYNDSNSDLKSNSNQIVNEKIITKQDALQAINDSEQIIKEMQEKNFSVVYMNDSLIEAKLVFEQARYAEILRDNNSTDKEKTDARNALRLVKWQDIDYADVLVYTNDIQSRKEIAYLLLDKISVEDNNLNNNAELKSVGLFSSSSAGISNETLNILIQAKLAFSEERYNDSENLLTEFNLALEKEKAQLSTLSGIKKGAMNFFQRYWIHIILLLIILGIVGYFTYKRYEKKLLINKIRKMKTEERVLNDLMKKTQTERFKENKISGLVYNIRMKKYEERLQEIKEELPVLEERLRYCQDNGA
ncbi:hypothetical protein HYW76_00210 [Candidatus Pacearchaeota archaeon]|nr:hypothetical protein [Candidatus Pacearchaeota archaeon]